MGEKGEGSGGKGEGSGGKGGGNWEWGTPLSTPSVHTHYHNSNLIWRTVSRRVDEVIPSDHRDA